MLGQDQENDCPTGGGGGSGLGLNRKTYLRSVSWSDRSPRKSNQRPPPSSKPKLCLPSLPRLSISRPSFEEWPRAGSDDLGIWPQAATPGPRGSGKPHPSPNGEHPPREEFLFKKDKLAFFDKECSKIINHIYLGSDAVAKNREVLSKNGITHVLNCVGFVCPEYFKNDLVYKTLWLQDSPSEDITSILYDVFDYFEDVREQGGRVLVHCYQGVSRSTSLVIAYVMWRERQSFEEAFQYVKAARGVTNPNMGFACQLLLCQNRALAFLESPNSVLRMYRMAPHSPYDPLHLVPKMLNEPGPQGLDSRGSFVIHSPSAVYVWIGKHCVSVMTDSARTAAYQVIKYEMAQGPVLMINEGEETPQFWEALVDKQSMADENVLVGVGERKVCIYDLDFQIFHKALSGGVVPLLPLSGTISETCLPARENGWGKLRQKFASGLMKKFVNSSKLSCGTRPSVESDPIQVRGEVEYTLPSADLQSPSRFRSGSFMDICKEVDYSVPLPEPLLSRTSSSTSLDSFSSFLVNSPKFSSKSPSLSPSTSDYSSWFTFSPSSSNWSDSFQSSPSGGASPNLYPTKEASLAEHTCVLCEAKSPCKGISPSSIAERRGNNPPPLMKLPKLTDGAHAPTKLVRSCSFSLPEFEDDVMTDIDCNQDEEQPSSREESMLDADMSNVSQTPDREAKAKAKATSLILYKWPSMDKVKISCSALLDSRCVYIALIPGISLDTNGFVVYVWLGREASCRKCQNEPVDAGGSCPVSHLQWETIGTRFLKQMGLPADSPVQVVKEGEEPGQFLKHLNSISLGR